MRRAARDASRRSNSEGASMRDVKADAVAGRSLGDDCAEGTLRVTVTSEAFQVTGCSGWTGGEKGRSRDCGRVDEREETVPAGLLHIGTLAVRKRRLRGE